MGNCSVRIIARTPGEAPEEIRDQWIGLIMPACPVQAVVVGVLTHKRIGLRNGYAIQWDDAMDALAQKSPNARKWWEDNVAPQLLIFDASCCEIVPD